MALFEHVILLRQDLSSSDLSGELKKHEEILNDLKGNVLYKESWGLRNLAYKINKNRKGHYILLNIDGPPEAIVEYERLMRLDEDIIRFLTVKIKFIDEKPSPLIANKTERSTNSSSPEDDFSKSDT